MLQVLLGSVLLLFFLSLTLIDSHGIVPFEKINTPYEVVTHKVFLDISVEHQPLKRIHIVLFGNAMPKLVENFRRLCTGEMGTNKDGVKLHYKGTLMPKTQRYAWIEGGDLKRNNNTQGVSTYGEEIFADNFNLGHNGRGYVTMKPEDLSGKFSSLFTIINRKLDYFDNHYAVIGKVLYEEERLWLRNVTRYHGTEMGHCNWYVDAGRVKLYTPHIEILDSGELPLDGSETFILNPDYYKKDDL